MFNITTSEGGSFEFPSTLEDITLKQYLEFSSLVEATKPAELLEIERLAGELHEAKDKEKAQADFDKAVEDCNDIIMYKKIYPYFARVVAYFSNGITEEQIKGGKKRGDGMNIGQLEYLYNYLINMLNSPDEPEYTNVILVDGELWYLPQRYMDKSKLIEFAEAAQFEANLKDLDNGNMQALAKIMCVLVRKEDEPYSDKLLKREEMFMNWSLQNCLTVAFFLLRQSEISVRNFQIYTAAQDLMNAKQASKN